MVPPIPKITTIEPPMIKMSHNRSNESSFSEFYGSKITVLLLFLSSSINITFNSQIPCF